MERFQSTTPVLAHAYVMNLVQIYSSRPLMLKSQNENVYNRLFSLVFKKQFGSLEYCSPHVLYDVVEVLKNVDVGKR